MRLTTKLLKQIIKEELDNMTEEKSPILDVANAVGAPIGAPKKEEQIDEGFEALEYLNSLEPQELQAITSYIVKMLAGGAAAIGGLVAADAATDGGEKVDPRDDLYDDED